MKKKENKKPLIDRIVDLFNFPESTNYYPLIFTIIFVVILFQYSFSALESIFYDFRVRYDIGASAKKEIVVVYIDEESDEFLGESYPYTYVSHHKMFERLKEDKPLVVNYFINLIEPDTDVGEEDLIKFKKQIQDFTNQGGKFRFSSTIDDWGNQLPPEELREVGHSLSLINIDALAFAKDDVCRRMILNSSGEDSIHMWTANQYRKIKGKESLNAKTMQGSYYVKAADATFSLFRYPVNPLDEGGQVKSIPFHRVRVGNFPPGFFKDKIVLVGSKYLSNSADFLMTPFNKQVKNAPVLNVHAAMIESLINNKTVKEVPNNISYILCILISLFLSLAISRVKPSDGLLLTLILIVGTIISAYLLFVIFGYWIYISHIVLTVFIVYYIWVPFRAIGEYQIRYAIQEETKLLKKVENLKQNFISLMSHDLKTPVAKIAGLADVTRNQHRGNPDLEKNLSSIIDSTKELNGFITSILDLTKIESRNLDLNLVSKDLNLLIEEVVGELNFQAKQKQIKVEVDLAPIYPIQMDLTLIKRVLSNIIENAIKYSNNNTNVVVKSWDDDSWVYVEVKDTGPGIPDSDIEYIFEKFYRVKNDASHSIKGTGLGLYLVKYFVELHGGEISVESVVNNGTTFLVKLKNE